MMNNETTDAGNRETVQIPAEERNPNNAYTRADSIIAVFCLLFGYLFSRWVLFSGAGIGMTLFFAAVITGALCYFAVGGVHLNARQIVFAAVLLLFSLAFSVSSAGWVGFFCYWFLYLGFAYWLLSVSGNRSEGKMGGYFFFDMLKATFIMPFASFGRLFPALGGRRASTQRRSRTVWWVLLGLLLAVIPTAVITALLSSADSAFGSLLSMIAEKIDIRDLDVFKNFVYLLFGIPVALYIFSAFYGNLNGRGAQMLTAEKNAETVRKVKFVPAATVCAAVIPILAVYLLFFLSQSAYFLSAFSDMLPGDMTYAEYARRGFFELCAVSVINLVIIAVIAAFTKHRNGKSTASRVLSSLLSVFTLALIATALSKMIMYIGNYGLTQRRVYTSWFMILLALVFILILIKQIAGSLPFARAATAAAVVMLAVLAFGRIDANIARYNVEAYKSGALEEMDVGMFYELSDDAVEYAVGLLDCDDAVVAADAKSYLEQRAGLIDETPLRRYTLGTLRAQSALRDAGIEAPQEYDA